MSGWRVRQHYGFGAARVAIQPEAHRAGRASLRAGLTAIGEELTDGGPRASLRRIGGELPALLLGLLIVSAFVVTLSRDHSDTSAIEVVMLESLPRPLPPLLEEPVVEIARPPAPAPAEVTPEPPPKPPVERPARRPEPIPPPAASKPPPSPSPPPRPLSRPEPPKSRPRPSRPVMPAIARVEPPPSLSPSTPARPDRQRPSPIREATPRPQVDIAPVTPAPRAESRPAVVASRPSLPEPAPAVQRNRPRPTGLTAPVVARPEPPPPSREFRVAAATKAPARVAPRRPAPPSMNGGSRADLRAAAYASSAPSMPVPASPDLTNRVARVTVEVPGRQSTSASAEKAGLAGVPLGDLSACVSDREEDRLKQAIVAAVKTQEECVSHAGSYRFVQTRNLNAFLMWIDRAPERPVEDRCGELRHALECLRQESRG